MVISVKLKNPKIMKKAVIIYMPVVHKGYIDFIESCIPIDTIFLISKEVLGFFDNTMANTLERDLRALPAFKTKHILQGLEICKNVKILKHDNLDLFDQILVPKDEVVEELLKQMYPGRVFETKDIFLRWNWQSTQYQNPVMPDLIISNNQFDKDFMNEAVVLSKKSSDWWRQVATIIITSSGERIEAFNHHLPNKESINVNGDPRSNFSAGESIEISTAIHGEASAIANAAKKGISLDGAKIYVTTFPCPVCARLIVESGIKRVYYRDGYSRLDALELFNKSSVEVIYVSE